MRESAFSKIEIPSAVGRNDDELLATLYRAVEGVRWVHEPNLENIPAPVSGTILVFSYYRELLASAQIEIAAADDPLLQYVCARHFPAAPVLRTFRRRNRANLEHALATMLRLNSGPSRDPHAPGFLAEARLRVARAVRLDCFDLDV